MTGDAIVLWLLAVYALVGAGTALFFWRRFANDWRLVALSGGLWPLTFVAVGYALMIKRRLDP